MLVSGLYPTFYTPFEDEKMALTALEIKSITCPNDKDQIKKSDSNGLFLLIKNNNSKLWYNIHIAFY